MSKDLNKYFTKEDVWMANKHLKRFLLFTICYYSFKKCKLKPQVNANTPVRMAKVKKVDTASVGGDVEGNLIHCCWEYKMVQPL